MGLFNKIINSLYEDNPEPEKESTIDNIYKKPSTAKKDRASFMSRLVEGLYEDPSKNNKQGFISSFIDSLYEDTAEISFTDSDDIASTLEGVIGNIREYKKKLDMLSIGVDGIDKDSFPRAKEVVEGYLRLALKFKQDLEPYINSNKSSLPASTYLKLQTSLREFEKEFQSKVPEVKSLVWLTQMVNVNKSMKSIFNSGTLSDISTNEIQKYYDYVKAIASQKDTFVGYKSELIHELLISEYRLTMISLMRRIGSGERVIKSPFAGLDSKKIDEFEQFFLDDYNSASEQLRYIMALRKMYIDTGRFSENIFDELSALADSFDEKLSTFMVNDYSISEIFSDNPDYFNTLKLFIRIKLTMNTMNVKYRKAIEEQERE